MHSENNSDLYGDGEAMPPNEGGPVGDDGMDQSGPTATLPKSLFAGKPVALEPGATFEMEVVRVHDDEVEVRCKHGGEGYEEKSETEPEPEMRELMEG